MSRRSLNLLAVKRPCAERWDEMNGSERVRHCVKCSHDVENLSAMTEESAASWLRGRTGHVCVRIDRDERGKILFAVGAAVLVAACSSPSATPTPAPSAAPPPTPLARPSAEPSSASSGDNQRKRSAPERRTVGCVCLAGDPLCSCL